MKTEFIVSVIAAPTKPGKRENIPFTIESVTSLFCDTRPNDVE